MFEKMHDFSEFMRFRICFFTAFLGTTGYLLFRSPTIELLYVYFASFLLCAGVYSHNNIVDTGEDGVNRGRSNPFSKNKRSYFSVLLFYVSGILLSLFSEIISFFPMLLFAFLGVLYNLCRIKRYPFIKNLYTSFGVSLIFLAGIPHSNAGVLPYYVIVYLLFLIGSLISDIRDLEGDKFMKVKTLPVIFGEQKAKFFVVLLMLSVFSMILAAPKFYILLPFEFMVLILLFLNKIKLAHNIGGFSIFFLSLWLVF